MYARVVTTTASTEQLDEGLRKYREELLPSIAELDGFRGNYTLADRGTGKIVNLSLWDTETAMNASEAAVAPLRAQAVQGTGGTDSTVESFEVVIGPEGEEFQRLAANLAQAKRDLEAQVRRLAASDEVTNLLHQVESALKSFEDWARRRGGPGAPRDN